ncbi:MAG: patatin-like phospholipase family protein [Chloroflexi bacterium]|nr:patatin-like phospholipase family protein [Chloroflexota bacterium]
MKEIAVALGGGGARGNAHIGVLRTLENAGYQISAIAGTSFGGLVAAFYAVGYSPDEIEAIFDGIDQKKLYELGLHNKPAVLGLKKIDQWLDEKLKGMNFEETRIPCAMTAANLLCSCEVTLKSGALKNAVLATIAVPGIFPPYKTDEHYLVDGGILNPVPVSLARELAPDLPVVAVALTQPLSPSSSYHLPLSISLVIPDSIIKRITRLNVAQAMNVFLQSVDMSNRTITELRLKNEPPDILIRPDVEGIGLLDEVDVPTLARLGEDATKTILPDLKLVMRRSQGFFKFLFGRKK